MKDLKSFYLKAKSHVINAGYNKEIDWQASRDINKVTEQEFLRELAWVVLASGMKESIIRKIFPQIASAFHEFGCLATAPGQKAVEEEALKSFNNKRKIRAIYNNIDKLQREGFNHFISRMKTNPIKVLQEFAFIGPITCYHLAKNIGLPVAKPDRHLVRIAQREGYNDVQAFCEEISRLTGDSVPVVDIVLWRYATLIGTK
jgi:3-methyladenine DNA glycosylase Tag